MESPGWDLGRRDCTQTGVVFRCARVRYRPYGEVRAFDAVVVRPRESVLLGRTMSYGVARAMTTPSSVKELCERLKYCRCGSDACFIPQGNSL